MLQKKKNPSIIYTNFLFLIIALLITTIGGFFQQKNLYIGTLILEYLMVFLPIIFYLKIKRYDLKEVLRLNRISFKQIVYIVFIVLFSYPIAVFFNYIGLLILSRFGRVLPNQIPIPENLKEFLIEIIIISLTPCICEEVAFRGLIMKSYENLGRRKAIIYSAILFGLFHFNLQNLLGPIFLGLLFGVLVYKTNSIFASMIGHMVNNTIALLIGFYSNKLDSTSIEALGETLPEMSAMIVGAIGLFVVVILFWSVVRRLIKSIPSYAEEQSVDEDLDIIGAYSKNMSIVELVPIVVVIIMYIIYNYKLFFD